MAELDVETLETKTKLAFQRYKKAEIDFHNVHYLLNEAKKDAGVPILPERKKREKTGEKVPVEKSKKPAAADKKRPKEKKEKAVAAGEENVKFVCAGNVLTGEPCPGGEESKIKAASTRGEDGKLHDTCKGCKKLVKKAKRSKKSE